jgi:hypothetical protein
MASNLVSMIDTDFDENKIFTIWTESQSFFFILCLNGLESEECAHNDVANFVGWSGNLVININQYNAITCTGFCHAVQNLFCVGSLFMYFSLN